MNSNLFSIHFCVGTLFLSLGMYIILLITFDGWLFVSGMAPLPSLLPSWVHLLEDQDGPVPLPPQPPAVGFLLYVFYFKKMQNRTWWASIMFLFVRIWRKYGQHLSYHNLSPLSSSQVFVLIFFLLKITHRVNPNHHCCWTPTLQNSITYK